MRRHRVRLGLAASALVISTPAWAQRTDDNATQQAEDAFGTSVGNDTIGIYNPFLVRGFSPVAAGNVRLEGLYFDQQTDLANRIIEGSTIRVGISAQSYAFPAPTGIADFRLRRPGAKPLTSIGLTYGPLGGGVAELDVQLPIVGEQLGLAAGVGFYRSTELYGGTPEDLELGVTGRWAPRAGVEVVPFWSRIRTTDAEVQPLIFTTTGDFLPRRIARGEFFGQDWADFAAESVNAGVVARADPLGFDVRLGVFRSVSNVDSSPADLLFGTERDGSVAQRIVIVSKDDRSASTSGELRVSRSFIEGPRKHTLMASVRGRAQDRRYGGEAVIDLGPSIIGEPDKRPEPSFVTGAKTRDEVRQTTFGVSYQGQWRGVGELSLGVQKSDYRKTVTSPDPTIVFPETKDSPILPSANAAIYLTPKLALYGGYTEGLEESPVAPSEAINLNEAPPAIRTRQKDAGLRWAIGGMTAVAGVFDVEKPYFNLDASSRFRQLGMVRHRGIELSIAGQPLPGLSVVAGNVFLDATVSGEEVASGAIGERPIGTFKRHTIASIDYRIPGMESLSFDAFFEGTSDRTANSANTLVIPTRAVINVGTRYRFRIGKAQALLRGQVGNVVNTFGWSVGGSGLLIPNGPRRFTLSLAADI